MRNNLLSSARFANIYINLQTRNQDKHLVPKAPEAPELQNEYGTKTSHSWNDVNFKRDERTARSLIKQCLNKKSKNNPSRNCHMAGCKGDLTKLLIISE